MTLSGTLSTKGLRHTDWVLIPLLVDDPLRGYKKNGKQKLLFVLIPLLVDDPLRELKNFMKNLVTLS